jgi:hypothetical protein
MDHKVKTVKVLKWHKIHPKAKARMNIPLLLHDIHVSCEAKPQKLMCSRWNKCSKWAIKKATKFSVSPTNGQREEAFVVYHIHEWDDHWKVVNASFE